MISPSYFGQPDGAKPGRDAIPDPWQAAASDAAQDASSNWLLSYSDLMTLLFTFFVMLFAYQKALPGKPVAALANPPAATTQAAPAPVPAPIPAPQPATLPTQPPGIPAAMPIAHAPAPEPPEATGSDENPAPPTAMETDAAVPEGPPRWLSMSAPATAVVRHSERFEATPGEDIEISQAPGQVRLEIGDSILFDPASAELKSNGGGLLDRLAQWLRTQPGTIAVEGHTDDRPITAGRYRSNWELSSARASTVARGLIERGIPAERLRAVGLADTQPKATNATPAGRTSNRRVALVVFLERGKEVKI